MQRVNAMDEKLSLEGFDAVWQRVTEHREPDTPPMQSIASHDQAVCLVKQAEQSCAVRFIPKT